MKIGLILPGNIWFCPYVKIYTNILKQIGVSYDIISWNRDGSEEHGIQFNKQCNNSRRLLKFIPYLNYASFVKKTIERNKYDKLIVFGPQIAIFLCDFLAKDYKNRYIFDYRDLSIEQKFYFKLPFKKVLNNSFANVISSPGFKKCLPSKYEYLLSHNFNIDAVLDALGKFNSELVYTDKIKVLTIGGIRDYSSNIEVVKALSNREDFLIQFVGKGMAAGMIENYAKENEINNIEFKGFYPKEEEAGYIRQASFLNIFYPRVITHDTALSNRFYNALIFRKPMIVTSDTTQGNYVEQYKLGLSLDNCENLDVIMKDYLKTFDSNIFAERCDVLLSQFLEDYKTFDSKVREFCEI